MKYLPLFLAILAIIGVGFLVSLDKKESLNQPLRAFINKLGVANGEATGRMLSNMKGFLLIILLAMILGAFILYLP